VAKPSDPQPSEDIIRALEELHTEHYRQMPQLARLTSRATAVLANPRWVGVVLVFVALWIGANTLGGTFGLRPFDPYPFALLEMIGTICAVVITLLILATQSRADRLDDRRSQMTLQIAALSEQKIAKVIALIEEQRRDSPHLESRRDTEADQMAAPADPKAVLDRIVDTQGGRESG
jgi:uncharacterized membrane protein